MPPTRNVQNETQSVALRVQNRADFKFPGNSHLLITTRKRILAWDAAGIHTVFQSRKGGIVAAREARDGSGMLAVAGPNVIVMHDTKRKQQRSWGLNANEVCLR